MKGTERRPARRVAAATLILALVFVAACQPTPEKEIVISKADGRFEELLSAEPLPPAVYAAPELWSEDYTVGKLTCDIDAEVVVSDTDTYPVWLVTRREFIDSDAEHIAAALAPDAVGVRETTRTREEIERELTRARLGQRTEIDFVVTFSPYEGQEEDIARLEAELSACPEITYSPVTARSTRLPMMNTYLLADGGNVGLQMNERVVYMYDWLIPNARAVQAESWVISDWGYPGWDSGPIPETPLCGIDDAIGMARETLGAIGAVNMELASYERGYLINSDMNDSGMIMHEIEGAGWYIVFARSDGRCVPFDSSSASDSGMLRFNAPDYIAPWSAERLSVYVDETGVRYLNWSDPLTAVKLLNENVALMPFDDVKERFLELLKQGGSWIGGEEYVYDFFRLQLSSYLLPVRNEPEYGMLVPVWTLYYNDVTYADGAGSSPNAICVNAVDGSLVAPQFITSEY